MTLSLHFPLIHLMLALVLAPLLPGLIHRTKAIFAGRTGPPLLQTYFDLLKLAKKGTVYSRTAGGVLRLAPPLSLAAILLTVTLIPFGHCPALLGFPGDFLLAAYLLGLARFAILLGAIDTGSSFEGMGASREAAFSALAEPVFLLAVLSLARLTRSLSLSEMYASLAWPLWRHAAPAAALVFCALAVVLLTENARIPVDDPSTHLELTMIHEAMVLDYGGPDLAMILYGAALKLWLFGALCAGLFLPAALAGTWAGAGMALGVMGAVAVGIGIVESVMARLRLVRIPPLLVGAGACALFALLLTLR